ncbi:Amino-oxidase domain-containing protein [Aphelenchoides fujianensis]|nr:Amino-oxidase domain-containing protein [Aphelenchoides fujianensis]
MPQRIVAIGAAPTSLGFAYRLHELQQEGSKEANDVELIEAVPGGLSCTVTDEAGFLWDMGGHITFSHNFPYYEKATRWAVDEWNSLQRNCLVDMNYLFDKRGIHLVPYPAQFAERYESPPQNTPENFEEWILNHFGPTILDCFFKPYTRKVWTVDTAKMSPNWVGTRVAKLPQEKLESLCAMDPEELEATSVQKADFGWGPNASFSFPKYGGTGAVWKQMAGKLPQKWFRYESRVVAVDPKAKSVRYVVGKGADEKLVRETRICPELNLEHNKVFIVGVGLKLPMPESMQPFTWLYFPDPNVPFYRVTFLSRYGEVTPDSSKYWSVMCECARTPDDKTTAEEIRDLAVEGLITKSIIQREQIVSVYYTTLPYGYPIPTVQRDSELTRAHRALESQSIYSRGRFGGWKYEVSNQDHCFIQGKELADRLVLDIDEKLYRTGIVAEKRG